MFKSGHLKMKGPMRSSAEIITKNGNFIVLNAVQENKSLLSTFGPKLAPQARNNRAKTQANSPSKYSQSKRNNQNSLILINGQLLNT